MKGNNLSNRFSPIIAFRIEGFLLNPSESKLDNMLSKLSKDPFNRWKLNTQAVKLISHIWRTTDYSINLYAINHPLSLGSIEKKMEAVPHSHVFVVDDYVELREHLDMQYTLLYFDNDKQALSVVGSMGKQIDEISKLVR